MYRIIHFSSRLIVINNHTRPRHKPHEFQPTCALEQLGRQAAQNWLPRISDIENSSCFLIFFLYI